MLPALSGETIELIRGILHAVDDLYRPQPALTEQLLQLFTPKPMEQCFKLI